MQVSYSEGSTHILANVTKTIIATAILQNIAVEWDDEDFPGEEVPDPDQDQDDHKEREGTDKELGEMRRLEMMYTMPPQ